MIKILNKKIFFFLIIIISIFLWIIILNNKEVINVYFFIEIFQKYFVIINQNLFTSSAIFSVIYAIVITLGLPLGTMLSLTAGFFFGGVLGAIIITLGSTTGYLFHFIISKFFLQNYINNKILIKFPKAQNYFNKNDFEFMLLIRLIPILPYFIKSFILAGLGASISKFYFTSIIGQIPFSFIYASIGFTLEQYLLSKQNIFELIYEEKIYLYLLISLIFLLIISILFKNNFKKKLLS